METSTDSSSEAKSTLASERPDTGESIIIYGGETRAKVKEIQQYLLYYCLGDLLIRPIGLFTGVISHEYDNIVPYILRRSNGHIQWMPYDQNDYRLSNDYQYVVEADVSPRTSGSMILKSFSNSQVYVYGEVARGFRFGGADCKLELTGRFFMAQWSHDGLYEEPIGHNCIIELREGVANVFVCDCREVVLMTDRYAKLQVYYTENDFDDNDDDDAEQAAGMVKEGVREKNNNSLTNNSNNNNCHRNTEMKAASIRSNVDTQRPKIKPPPLSASSADLSKNNSNQFFQVGLRASQLGFERTEAWAARINQALTNAKITSDCIKNNDLKKVARTVSSSPASASSSSPSSSSPTSSLPQDNEKRIIEKTICKSDDSNKKKDTENQILKSESIWPAEKFNNHQIPAEHQKVLKSASNKSQQKNERKNNNIEEKNCKQINLRTQSDIIEVVIVRKKTPKKSKSRKRSKDKDRKILPEIITAQPPVLFEGSSSNATNDSMISIKSLPAIPVIDSAKPSEDSDSKSKSRRNLIESSSNSEIFFQKQKNNQMILKPVQQQQPQLQQLKDNSGKNNEVSVSQRSDSSKKITPIKSSAIIIPIVEFAREEEPQTELNKKSSDNLSNFSKTPPLPSLIIQKQSEINVSKTSDVIEKSNKDLAEKVLKSKSETRNKDDLKKKIKRSKKSTKEKKPKSKNFKLDKKLSPKQKSPKINSPVNSLTTIKQNKSKDKIETKIKSSETYFDERRRRKQKLKTPIITSTSDSVGSKQKLSSSSSTNVSSGKSKTSILSVESVSRKRKKPKSKLKKVKNSTEINSTTLEKKTKSQVKAISESFSNSVFASAVSDSSKFKSKRSKNGSSDSNSLKRVKTSKTNDKKRSKKSASIKNVKSSKNEAEDFNLKSNSSSNDDSMDSLFSLDSDSISDQSPQPPKSSNNIPRSQSENRKIDLSKNSKSVLNMIVKMKEKMAKNGKNQKTTQSIKKSRKRSRSNHAKWSPGEKVSQKVNIDNQQQQQKLPDDVIDEKAAKTTAQEDKEKQKKIVKTFFNAFRSREANNKNNNNRKKSGRSIGRISESSKGRKKVNVLPIIGKDGQRKSSPQVVKRSKSRFTPPTSVVTNKTGKQLPPDNGAISTPETKQKQQKKVGEPKIRARIELNELLRKLNDSKKRVAMFTAKIMNRNSASSNRNDIDSKRNDKEEDEFGNKLSIEELEQRSEEIDELKSQMMNVIEVLKKLIENLADTLRDELRQEVRCLSDYSERLKPEQYNQYTAKIAELATKIDAILDNIKT